MCIEKTKEVALMFQYFWNSLSMVKILILERDGDAALDAVLSTVAETMSLQVYCSLF